MSVIAHAMMPDYANMVTVSLPYTATADGYIYASVKSTGGGSSLSIDGQNAITIGQTISGSSYVETGITVPIAKGQVASASGTVEGVRFIPLIGN